MVVSGPTINARSLIMIMPLRQEQYEDLSSEISALEQTTQLRRVARGDSVCLESLAPPDSRRLNTVTPQLQDVEFLSKSIYRRSMLHEWS